MNSQHASACLSRIKKNFVGPLTGTHQQGSQDIRRKARTWSDEGYTHSLKLTVLGKHRDDWIIPDTYEQRVGCVRLFLLQHWATTRRETSLHGAKHTWT